MQSFLGARMHLHALVPLHALPPQLLYQHMLWVYLDVGRRPINSRLSCSWHVFCVCYKHMRHHHCLSSLLLCDGMGSRIHLSGYTPSTHQTCHTQVRACAREREMCVGGWVSGAATAAFHVVCSLLERRLVACGGYEGAWTKAVQPPVVCKCLVVLLAGQENQPTKTTHVFFPSTAARRTDLLIVLSTQSTTSEWSEWRRPAVRRQNVCSNDLCAPSVVFPGCVACRPACLHSGSPCQECVWRTAFFLRTIPIPKCGG